MDLLTTVTALIMVQICTAVISNQLIGSGTINSAELQTGETYKYLLANLPNFNTIIVFNILQIDGMDNKDLKIYEDPIDAQKTPTCMVYQKKEPRDGSICYNLWRTSYRTCTLNSVTDENCTLTFRNRENTQNFRMEHLLVDCNTGQILYDTIDRDPQSTTDKMKNVTNGKNTQTTASPQPRSNFDLSTIIPIAVSAIILIVIVFVVIFTLCRKKSTQNPGENVEEPPIYEEIPERNDGDISRMEDAYDKLSTDNDVEMKNLDYLELERQEKQKQETPVVRLLPVRSDRNHL